MTINISMPAVTELKPQITVMGVGGAGGNAVNNMISARLEGVDFVVTNTDAQSLALSLTERRIQLGVHLTQGLGAGSRPDIGRAAAEEGLEEIMEHLRGSHMVFITAGMGGGTGTGAAPVIAQVGREAGALTVAVVTKPFQFEGTHRMAIAEAGIEELQRHVDTLIIIPNQNLFRIANEKTTFADAFKMADDVLYSGVRGVTDLMVMPGLINLDFADIRTVMMEMGKAMMGTGEAEGERRALDAAEAAIANPLLDDVSLQGAKGILINITGGTDMTLFEVDEAANRIREEVDPNANIIFGSTFDENLEGRVRLSLVATGIDAEAAMPRLHEFAAAREDSAPMATLRTEPVVGMDPPAAVMRAEEDESEDLPVEPDVAREPAVAMRSGVAPASAMQASPAASVAPAVPPAAVHATTPMAPAGPAPEPTRLVPRQIPEVAADPTAQSEASDMPALPEEPAAGVAEATAENDAFIPPQPVRPGVRSEPAPAPDPFAEAAVANGAKRDVEKPSLFERVTGAARARKRGEETAENKAEPRLGALLRGRGDTKPDSAADASAEIPEARPARNMVSEPDEDLLEIPAFLRRQAN